MEKSANNFSITAFVATEPQVRTLSKSNVARFAISVSRKSADKRESALQNVETYRKLEAENANFADVVKGKRYTFSGYFIPEEWTDGDGKKHTKVLWIINSIDPVEDKPE